MFEQLKKFYRKSTRNAIFFCFVKKNILFFHPQLKHPYSQRPSRKI